MSPELSSRRSGAEEGGLVGRASVHLTLGNAFARFSDTYIWSNSP
jgi:hypothetical protein